MKSNLLYLILLVSCVNKQDQVSAKQRLYQPKVLILAPNTLVKSVDGDYISNPIEREIWHSSQTVESLEKSLSEFK